MCKKLLAVPVALVLLAIAVVPAFAWNLGVNASGFCDGTTAKWSVTASPHDSGDWHVYNVTGTGTGVFGSSESHHHYSVTVYWKRLHDGHWEYHDETQSGQINKPGCIQHTPVTLCHAKPPDTAANGYDKITTDDDGALQGHASQHSADIIPPFTYYGGSFPGQNWTTAGQNIWNHDCAADYTTQVVVVKNDCTGWELNKVYYLNGVEYKRETASGTWTQPFVLESATAFGQTVNEPTNCQQTHQVTWSHSEDCDGWKAFYSIDGGANVQYDSGSWGNVWVLESVDVPAFDIPTNQGELYNVTQVPIQHIDEPKNCQRTHQVVFDSDNNCTGWDAYYTIDGGGKVVYASGTWTLPFVLETANVGAFTIPTNPGELYDQTSRGAFDINEPKQCQQTHQVSWDHSENCTDWAAFYSIDGGAPVTYASGAWSDIYALEDVDVAVFDFPKNPGELYSISQIPGQHIDEPKQCQQPHSTDYWKDANCKGYSYGYLLDGQKVETGNGTWKDVYAPESVTVTVKVPKNEGEIYSQTEFTFSIDKDMTCVKCRVEIVYPMAAYTDPNAPANYWREGTCWVIHPDGKVPSADRVTHICSLCPKQTADGKGYEYHGMNMYYDGYLVRITCWGQNPTYWYNGEQIPEEWVHSDHFNPKGERTGGCYQSCQ